MPAWTNTVWPLTTLALATAGGAFGWWVGHTERGAPAPVVAPAPPAVPPAAPPGPEEPRALLAPDPSTIPDGALGDAVRRGQYLASHTREALPDYVGADLNCTNCHLGGGTVGRAGPWVGLAGVFPEYRSRSDSVVTLEARIDDCFERSVNGRKLPMDGPDMAALVAYVTWLSKDVPVGVSVEGRGFPKLPSPPTPDPEHGREVYAAKCAACHGADGQGQVAGHQITFPPLWGDGSFNVGAGMARLDTAAAFVKWNMPLGQGGSLTDQEAYDVAAFFTTQPRPDFAGKVADWPKGGKPPDARY